MRVAIAIEGFPKLSETFILYSIKGLIERGVEIEVFATSREEEKLIHAEAKRLDYEAFTHFSPSRPNGIKRITGAFKTIFSDFKKYKSLLRSFNYFKHGSYGLKGYLFYDLISFAQTSNKDFDLIHSHFSNNGERVALALDFGLLKGKHITHFHGHDLLRDDFIQSYNGYERMFSSLDGLVFNSDFLKSVFNDKFKKYTHFPSAVIHEPLDPNKFTIRKTLSGKTGTQDSKFHVITVGRLVSWKGQPITVDAIHQLSQNRPDIPIVYHIVGHGEDYELLEQKIQELGLASQVILHGPKVQDDVKNLLAKSQVFVLFGDTNYRGEIDTQGVVIQEASCVGLPVIVSDAGGMKEGVVDGETGLVIKEGSIDDLEKALIYLYENTQVANDMGVKGNKYVSSTFNVEEIASQMHLFYTKMLSEK